MLHASESQQVLDRLSGEIEDLRTIARLHGLPTGSPDRITVLPLRLSQDSRLRSDLTELVRSLQTRDPELGLSEVLSLVLAAVGGPTALTPHRDLAEAVDLTGSFLASLGGWPGSAVEPLIDIDNPPDHDPRLDLAAAAYTDTLEAKLASPNEPEQEETAFAPPAMEHVEEEQAASANGTVTLAEITHALARLERGNLELRLHLDSIDQRICRMEPLLEAVPHTVEPDGPPPPEPPHPTRPSMRFESPDRHVAAGNLIYRGSTSPDPPSPAPAREIDPQDEIKEKRRISLTSNFPDPANIPAPQSLAGTAPPIATASIPGAVADPISHPRMSMPRRDRFAAARELPSNPPDADPLYAPTAEELAAATPQPIPPAEPAPLPMVYADLGTDQQVSLHNQPSAPLPESSPVFETPRVHEEQLQPAAPAPERSPAPSPSADLPIAAPLFGTTRGSHPSTPFDHEEEPTPRRRMPWIAGLAAASVIGAAGFLYLNGLPAPINEWVTGNHTTVATTDSPANTADPSSPGPNSDTSTPANGTKPAPAAGRVLGARESFTPSESVERTTPPTFVPGGVMDGYLVSAPRPNYPSLANLVGLQGKITFEAMISKSGEVEALKVLGGPQGLRDAATDAVKQWQYRPFEVKGRPVEVRTIIRVDVGAHAGTPADQDPLR